MNIHSPSKSIPYYQPLGEEVGVFETCYDLGLAVLLKGPTGCGKTRFVEYMAAKLGKPLFTVACHDDLSASDLIGRYLLKGNDTEWNDGPLTRAVRQGGICYLDEIVEARKDTTVILHPLTDNRRRLIIERTNEELEAPPEFMLVASFNPGYQNIMKRLKPSTRQRFISMSFGFPEFVDECQIVANESGLDIRRVESLVRLGGNIRRLSGMDLEEGVSTRLLIYAASLMAKGMKVDHALQVAIYEPLSDEDDVKTALRDLASSVYG